MTETQLTGVRQLWDAVTTVVKNKKTAREMAETPHTLSKDGKQATTADGHMWIWDDRFFHWAMWK